MVISLKHIKKIIRWPAGTVQGYNPWYTILWRGVWWLPFLVSVLAVCLLVTIMTFSVDEGISMWKNIN